MVECLRESFRGATALLGLISKVLQFSRLESSGAVGGEPRPAAPLSLAALGEEVLEIVGPLASMGGVDLLLVIDPGLYHETLVGDAVSLRQCIVLLAENAVRFTPAGGDVVVRVSQVASLGGSADIPRRKSAELNGRPSGRNSGGVAPGGLQQQGPRDTLDEDCAASFDPAVPAMTPLSLLSSKPQRSRSRPTALTPARCSLGRLASTRSGARDELWSMPTVYVEVSVADTGVGIPADQHHLLLRPFSQARPEKPRCGGI